MSPGAAQHRDTVVARVGAGSGYLLTDKGDFPGQRVVALEGVRFNRRRRVRPAYGGGRGVGHPPAVDVIRRRERGCKAGVDPVHHPWVRAKITVQLQVLQPHPVEPFQPRLQEQPDVGTAKAIDGLHTVTDDHDCAGSRRIGRIVLAPAAGECVYQLVLVDGGILEFVHQDVLDLVIQAQGQFRGRIVIPQCLQGGQRDLAVIHRSLPLEDQQQLGCQ